MRIAIIGAGAIGGFYGMMLAKAGHDVHFVMRSDYAAVKEGGFSVRSHELGNFQLQDVNVYRDATELPSCDWIIVAAKTTSNDTLAPVLAKVAPAGSKVLILQNGYGVEQIFRRHQSDSVHLLGGLCVISVHRTAPGVIEHFSYGTVNVGYHSGPEGGSEVLNELQAMFEGAGLNALPTTDLETARWQKLVMNIPFSGLTVLLDSGTGSIMREPTTRRLVRDIMEEVELAAIACGHPLPEGYLDEAWAATDGKGDFNSSMQLDFKAGRPMELDSIYAAPLASALGNGCVMPKVAMLYQSLCFLENRNNCADMAAKVV